MPELPEVESMARFAARQLGDRLIQVVVIDPKILSAADAARFEDRPITSVRRRAKHLLIDLGGPVLWVHFRMTGTWRRWDGAPGPGLRLGLVGAVGSIVLHDPRRLATARVADPDVVEARLAAVGPDPWPVRRDGSFLRDRLSCAAPIKVALLDQARLGGLGNIAGSDICWRAGVDPRTPAATLPTEAWARLADAVWSHLDETIRGDEGGEIHLLSVGSHSANPFLIYGRDGAPCPRCGTTIERFAQRGRGTWWCPRCQGRSV